MSLRIIPPQPQSPRVKSRPMSFPEIAKQLGLSRQRVWSAHQSAIRKLRKALREMGGNCRD